MLLPANAFAQVNMTFNAPTYGFNVLGGSVRTLNVRITGGTTNLVDWSVIATTGGASAILSASTSTIPVVTATFGSVAGACSIIGNMGSYAVISTATVTIQAQSVDDTSKTALTTVKVCNPAVQVAIVPFYRVLYASQKADLQSFIVGSSNLNVTWAITSQPSGGNGTLADTNNRDTVFFATIAGRYTLTATSVADNTKTATAIMYVTGKSQSYSVTPNETEPIDCTIDPSATGTTYEVGPTRAYTTIQSVPMNTMPAGSTVRIHNDDTTGMSPTTYYEYFQIVSKNGTASQPLRVVGCPDSFGNLPIVDASNATGASWVSTGSAAGYGVASITGASFGYYQAGNPTNNYDVIEGLHIKNARPGFTYTPPSGGSAVGWIDGASCINIRNGYQLVFAGNDLDNCSNGAFSDANLNSNAWGGNVLWVDWEGNHIHNSGVSGEFTEHQLYLQGWGQLVQFNRIDNLASGAEGANLKSRGIFDTVRYNYFGDGPTGQLDMVELQDSNSYEQFEYQYLGAPGDMTCADSWWCQGDMMGPNILAGWQEAYHWHFVYGNVFVNSTAEFANIFSEDHDGGMADRLGVLYYYNNTFDMVGSNATQAMFQTTGASGNAYLQYEFPQVQAANNIVWSASTAFPYWNENATILATFTTNLLNANWGNITTPINGGSVNGHTGYGWSNATDIYSFSLAIPLNAHLYGLSPQNFLTTSTQPFDSTTFSPPTGSAAIGAGSILVGAMAFMPVRFAYHPDTSVVVLRINPQTLGAIDPASATTLLPPTNLRATVE
jgi:hypothetical protein